MALIPKELVVVSGLFILPGLQNKFLYSHSPSHHLTVAESAVLQCLTLNACRKMSREGWGNMKSLPPRQVDASNLLKKFGLYLPGSSSLQKIFQLVTLLLSGSHAKLHSCFYSKYFFNWKAFGWVFWSLESTYFNTFSTTKSLFANNILLTFCFFFLWYISTILPVILW